jgi:hypothetical protein
MQKCVASDGRYAVFLVLFGYAPYPPPPGPQPAVVPLEDLALFVDLKNGDAAALRLAHTRALEELHRFVDFGDSGVYIRGVAGGGTSGVLVNNTLVVSKTFYAIRVKLDPARLKTPQPLEYVSGTFVRVPQAESR